MSSSNIDWSTPQFIEQARGLPPKDEANAKAEDITKWQPLLRTYEDHVWYYIVFAPYDRAYEADQQWFHTYCVDKARKWALNKGSAFFVTREVNATKVHSNLLICTSQDLHTKYHGKSAYNKYRINVSLLADIGDRQRVLSYITKENKERSFKLYQDYYFTK